MPRVVQVFANDSSSLGGAERVLGQISRLARTLGFEVEEVSLQTFPLRSYLRKMPMVDLAGKIWQLNHRLNSVLRPDDLVISHGMFGAFLNLDRHIYLFHSTYAGMADAMFPYLPRLDYWICRHFWGGFLEARNARRAQCVAVSQACSREAQRYYGVSARVISNALDGQVACPPESKEALRGEFGLDQDRVYLLVAGRREKLKGSLILSDLASRLPDSHRLVSVGSGPEIPGVHCLKAMPREQLPRLFKSSDWLLSPSRYEGFGLTLLEAWASGLPVMATRTGVAIDLAGDESSFDACLVAPNASGEELAQTVLKATADPSLAKRQVAWGRQQLEERYSQELFDAQWSELLYQSAKGRGEP